MLINQKNGLDTLVHIYVSFWLVCFGLSFLLGYQVGFLASVVILGSTLGFWLGWASLPKIRGLDWLSNDNTTLRKSARLRNIAVGVILLDFLLIAGQLSDMVANPWQYRQEFYQGDSALLQFQLLQSLIIIPLNIALVVLLSIYSSSKRFYMLSGLIFSYLTISAFGRFPLYYFAYFLLLYSIIRGHRLFSRKNVLLVICIVLLVSFSVFLLASKVNAESGLSVDLLEVIKLYLVNYHFIGFQMIDHLVTMREQGLLSYGYGSTSSGYLNWIGYLVSQELGVNLIKENSFMELQSIFNAGLYLPELDHTYNAFSTNLVPLIADLGIVWCIFFHFSLGFTIKIMAMFSRQYSCLLSFVVVTLFCMTFGLFQPLLVTNFFPLIALILLLEVVLMIRFTRMKVIIDA